MTRLQQGCPLNNSPTVDFDRQCLRRIAMYSPPCKCVRTVVCCETRSPQVPNAFFFSAGRVSLSLASNMFAFSIKCFPSLALHAFVSSLKQVISSPAPNVFVFSARQVCSLPEPNKFIFGCECSHLQGRKRLFRT